MSIELIILAIIILGGILLGDQLTQRRHIARARQQWHSDAASPVIGTICHGHYPLSTIPTRIFGALGLVDEQITFSGHRADTFDFTLPVTAIRWIGLRTIVKLSWTRRIEWPELVIHADTSDGWRVYTFTEGAVTPLAERIATTAGLTVHVMGEVFEDFGPTRAIYLIQDHDGQWQRVTPPAVNLTDPAPEANLHTHQLYLAPDRLLYDWRHAIPLAQIQRVDVYARRDLSADNPFDDPLLRIEYERDGAAQIAGFLVEHAGDWAGILEHRLDVPVTHHAIHKREQPA